MVRAAAKHFSTLDAVSVQGTPVRSSSTEFQRVWEKRTRKLRRCGTHKSDEARRVDDATSYMESFRFIRGVLAHRNNGIFGSPPDALKVNLHGQIPNPLLSVQGVIVLRMHDAFQNIT